VFEPGMEKQATLRVELESDLRRAIRNDELLLHYQPLLALPSGDIVGVEALIRWRHPTRGLIPPNDFIPIAEESDLVGELGRWVLQRSCTDLMAWRNRWPDGPDLSVAVNIATRQLLTPWLVDQVAEALETSGLPPRCLTLEITEGALMADTKASIVTLEALQGLGVRLAIDDFGTGWSSLARLRTFPADKLKIDRAFVSEISSPDDEAPLIAAVTAMAHSLGLRVVAEGVETPEQLACLDRLGVDEVQGFLLSRPIPEAAIVAMLEGDDGLVRTGIATFGDIDGDGVDAVLLDLQTSAGVDVVFLSSIDWDREVEQLAQVAGSSSLEVGAEWSLEGSPCVRALAGESLVADLARAVPSHLLGRSELRWLLTVPVIAGDRIWGTLSVAGRPDTPVPDPALLEPVLQSAARLVAESLAPTTVRLPSPVRPTGALYEIISGPRVGAEVR
jgi:EAL domain-containing protein (putative c-di-GMP-specific phosphodiesterase class I)